MRPGLLFFADGHYAQPPAFMDRHYPGRASPDAESPRVRNEDTEYGAWAGYGTFPERLEDNGVPWKIYQNEVGIDLAFTEEENIWLTNFGDNSIEYFSQYRLKFAPFTGMRCRGRSGRWARRSGSCRGVGCAGSRDGKNASGASGETDGKMAKIKKELAAAKQGLLRTLEADVLIYTQEAYDKLSRAGEEPA